MLARRCGAASFTWPTPAEPALLGHHRDCRTGYSSVVTISADVHALKYGLGTAWATVCPVLRQDFRHERVQFRRVAVQFYERKLP